MSLDDIAQILGGDSGTRPWREVIAEQVRNLQDRIDRMQAAKTFLEHVAAHHDPAPDGCPHYESFIWGSTDFRRALRNTNMSRTTRLLQIADDRAAT